MTENNVVKSNDPMEQARQINEEETIYYDSCKNDGVKLTNPSTLWNALKAFFSSSK